MAVTRAREGCDDGDDPGLRHFMSQKPPLDVTKSRTLRKGV